MNHPSFSPEQIEAVRAQFIQLGISISDWARQNGVKPALVFSILAGKNRCTRGKSHQVALLLGLKKAPERVSIQGITYMTASLGGGTPTRSVGQHQTKELTP